MSLRSALYVGTVSHHRLGPKRHTLRNRVYWLLLDLAELDAVDAGLRLFSHNAANLVSFHDRDHGDGSARPLYDQAVDQLCKAGIIGPNMNGANVNRPEVNRPVINEPKVPGGSGSGMAASALDIRLLAMPRVAGYDFNPLSVYFCNAPDGRPLAVIYEVNNTFGGRHSYVVPVPAAKAGDAFRQACDKTFYVSPFLPNDMQYRFRTRPPQASVSVAVQARRHGAPVLNTALVGHHRPLTDGNLAKLAITHPLLPLKVTGAIYWHGLKLWLRGFAVNPEKPSRTVSYGYVRPASQDPWEPQPAHHPPDQQQTDRPQPAPPIPPK